MPSSPVIKTHFYSLSPTHRELNSTHLLSLSSILLPSPVSLHSSSLPSPVQSIPTPILNRNQAFRHYGSRHLDQGHLVRDICPGHLAQDFCIKTFGSRHFVPGHLVQDFCPLTFGPRHFVSGHFVQNISSLDIFFGHLYPEHFNTGQFVPED